MEKRARDYRVFTTGCARLYHNTGNKIRVTMPNRILQPQILRQLQQRRQHPNKGTRALAMPRLVETVRNSAGFIISGGPMETFVQHHGSVQ